MAADGVAVSGGLAQVGPGDQIETPSGQAGLAHVGTGGLAQVGHPDVAHFQSGLAHVGTGSPAQVETPDTTPVNANPARADIGSGTGGIPCVGNTGHASVGNLDSGNAGAQRRLTAKPTVDTIEADILHQKVRQQTLHATDLRTLKGLTDLATQHFENFGKLRSGICGPMVPKRTLRIGTACTGSSADLISMIAIQKAALAALCADFTFKYVFNCEKTAFKRQWIAQLHNLCEEAAAHGPDGAAPGLVGEAPCLFENI